MEIDRARREITLVDGNEMEAVAICCGALAAKNNSDPNKQFTEAVSNLAERAVLANFTPPDPSTGKKQMLLSKAEAALAIDAALEIGGYDPDLPTNVGDAISQIAQIDFEEISK